MQGTDIYFYDFIKEAMNHVKWEREFRGRVLVRNGGGLVMKLFFSEREQKTAYLILIASSEKNTFCIDTWWEPY